MKKLLSIVIALLVSGALMAQGSKGKMTSKSFLAFHGGPSFPTADFNSKNMDNEKAGYAKTGFNLDLTYGYSLNKTIGLTGIAFYGRHNLDKGDLSHTLPGSDMDHWQYYGLAVGPMLTHQFSDKVDADLRVTGGMANANTPKFTFDGSTLIKEDWKWTPVFAGGFDLRFNTGGNLFIFTNADYRWMQPEFKITSSDGEVNLRNDYFHQTISTFNLTGGVGIKF